MHNPSLPLRSATDAGLRPHDLVAFLAQSQRWAGAGAHALAHAAAAALDDALHPDAVAVVLDDPATGETLPAIDGRAHAEASLSAAQWHEWLAPWLSEANERVAVIPHPSHAGKLRLRVARVGAEASTRYIALASADPAFPRERDELLLEVAAGQLSLLHENLRAVACVRRIGAAPEREPRAQHFEAELARGILDATHDCLGLLDSQGRLLYMNASGGCALEAPLADVPNGRDWLARWAGDDHEAAKEAVRAAREGGTGRFQGYCPTVSGQAKWCDVVVTGLAGAGGASEHLLCISRDITAKKHAEAASRARQAELQLMADAMPALIAYVDRAHIYRFANRRCEDWFGHAPAEIVGRHVAEVLGEAAYQEIRPHIERALAGERVTYEARPRYRAGAGERFVQGQYVPDRDDDGNVRGFFALVQDISERKRAEKALTEGEARFRNLADSAPVMIWMCDEDRRMVYVNRRWTEFTGCLPDRECESWRERIHPEDRQAWALEYARAFDAREPFAIDYRVRRRDGHHRWVHDTGIPRFDADGSFHGYIGSIVDITALKQVDEERARMLERERTARAEAEQLRDLGIALNSELDVGAVLQQATDAGSASVGAWFGAFFYKTLDAQGEEAFRLETLSGVPWEAFTDSPLPRDTALFIPTFQGEAVVRCDDIRRDPRHGRSEPSGAPAGHLPVTSYLAVPVRSRSGELLGGLVFGHPEPGRFSESHEHIVAGIAAQAAVAIDNARLFDAVREQAERLRITHAQAPMGIAEVDLGGRFQTVNDRFCQIVGYARAELIGRHFADLTHAQETAGEDGVRRLLAGEIDSYQVETRCLHKEGRPVWARLSVALVRDDTGAPRYAVGVVEDITEQQQAEERRRFLAEASKQLAASLDPQETLAYVARLAVPAMADWCAIDIIGPDGTLVQLAIAHADDGKLEQARALRRSYPPDPASRHGAYHALRTGRTQLVPEVSDEQLASVARDEAHLAQLRALGLGSYACVPLAARDRTLGVITLVQADSGRNFVDADREFIEELARRAAVALDNAQLFEAMREQAERLQATYDRAAIGISETAPDGRYLGVNDRFCAITGYPREELLQLRYQDVTHPEDVAASVALFDDLQAGRVQSYQLEKRYVRKDGTHVWVNLTASLVHDADGRPKYGIGAVEDITERRRAESVITGQKKALQQMAEGEGLATVLETLVDTFERQSLGSAAGSVSVLDGEGRFLRPIATGRLPAAWVRTVQEVPVAPDMGSCSAAAFYGETVIITDLETDPRWSPTRERALAHGFRSGWAFCLRRSSGQVLGTFGIFCREPRGPTEQELRFIELIADTAAIAIERYRDERSLWMQAEVLNQVHDAVMMVGIDGRVRRWNAGAERLFDVPAAEALGRELAALSPSPEAYAWLEANLIEPAKRDGRYEGLLPLRRRNGSLLYAHVSVSLVRDEHGMPDAMLAYVLDVTPRVEAEKALSARARQQEAVAWLGKAALSSVELQTLMDEAVRLVADTLGVHLCEVLELRPDGEQLLLRAGVGWNEGLVGQTGVSTGLDSQAGFALVSKEPVIVADLRTETRFRGPPLLREHHVVSGMSVIVHSAGGEPYGVLGAYSKHARHFSGHDVNFLQSVAHILSSAIQRRRFEEAMQRARDELESRVEARTAELAQANQSLRDEVVERMGVESALRESEAQYRMLFERNPLPAWVFDIHTLGILAANETAVWQYGYTREEFLRINIHDLHPPEEASRALDYAEQFPPETAYIGVWKHRKQDETVIDVEVFVYEVLFQGRWARLMLANDITERRRTEREFRLLETITRSISEARDLDAALYAVLRHICETTGWVLGEAWLPSQDQRHMRCSRAWYCGAEGLEEFRHAAWELELERGQGVTGRAWATGQPLWVADVTEDEAFGRTQEARAAGLRAAIAFPVLAEGEVVALLAFFLRQPWLEDEHQVKLVSTIARQAGIAIQRKLAEDRLRESEERFRVLVEGAHDYAIFMLDPEGRVASWNKGAERLKGYPAEEILGQSLAVFYTPEDAAREVPQQAVARARTGGVFEAEGWRMRKSGERFWASVVMTALRDPRGTLKGFVKVTRDITERKQAEERFKESEARLARAQEFSLLMVAHLGLDGRWLKVPPMLCAALACREEELLASRFEDVTHPDDFPAEWEQCRRLIRGEMKSFDLEKRLLRRDGKIIWVYQNTSIVLDAEDRPLHFLTFIRDITERKEAEDQLHRSRMQLSEAQRVAHLGSWEWDIATGRLEWSEELYRIYGVPVRTPLTYDIYMGHVYPEDRERVNQTMAAALETRQPFTVEERIVRTDGELRHLLRQGAVVAGPKGEVTRMVGVCLDITERKRAEERLREYTQRLQSLSQRLLEAQETERRRIARELHDQIGQDLSVIKINLQALQRLPGAAAVSAPLEETVRVVEGVLATARNLSVELRPSMLDDLGLVAALRWYLDRQVQRAGVALHFAADDTEIRMSSTIETACFRLAQETLTNVLRHAAAEHVHVTLQNQGEKLEMRITDDGKGFDVEAARARASQGESFGLLGMEERALLAGGQLEIISAPGRGTTVIARFPLTSSTVHAA